MHKLGCLHESYGRTYTFSVMNLVTLVLVTSHSYEVYSRQGELNYTNCVLLLASHFLLCVTYCINLAFGSAIGMAKGTAVTGMKGRVRDLFCARLTHVYNSCSSHYIVCWLIGTWKKLFVNKRRYRLY